MKTRRIDVRGDRSIVNVSTQGSLVLKATAATSFGSVTHDAPDLEGVARRLFHRFL
jgi:hypothetical protein